MLPSDLKKLKQLEEENGKLKKLKADLRLDKIMLYITKPLKQSVSIGILFPQ
jgi:hypothetical protein